MGMFEFVLGLLTLVLGTGWLFTWKAYKRKNNGEATQAEAEGWEKMQELYQKTIADFDGYCNDMRKERSVLKTENNEMREKYKKMDDEILALKRQISRQGRKIEALSPFLCNVVGCLKRKKVNIGSIPTNDSCDDDNNDDDIDENKQ